MSIDSPWGDECFYCMVCQRPFRSPLFSVTRSVERMYYYEGNRLPEAEVLSADSIGTYCCKQCLDSALTHILHGEGVRVTNPGPGPIETCSHCERLVDMTQPHLVWTREEATVIWSQTIDVIKPTAATTLAVRCQGLVAPDSQQVVGESKALECVSIPSHQES